MKKTFNMMRVIFIAIFLLSSVLFFPALMFGASFGIPIAILLITLFILKKVSKWLLKFIKVTIKLSFKLLKGILKYANRDFDEMGLRFYLKYFLRA